MKINDQRQMSLFDQPEPVAKVSLRDCYVEQIRRDMRTLQEGPDYWHPSKEFFEERINNFREAVLELDGRR